MKKYHLKSQFIILFVCILMFSLFFTIVTYIFAFYGYKNILPQIIVPGNYFETNLPNIQKYIDDKGEKILDPKEQDNLEELINGYGGFYQVLDKDANVIYGENSNIFIKSKYELYSTINVTTSVDGNYQEYKKVIPIIDKDGQILGGVLIIYKITPSYKSSYGRMWTVFYVAIFIIAPFLYIIIFTIICSKILTRNISQPLKMLVEASKNIKEKNLDFNIDYKANNEIGQLCTAFNEMKLELESSLCSQWRIEQEKIDMIESLVHDMKTPLAIINGYVELIEEENINNKEKLLENLKIIKKNIRRGLKFINKIQYNEANGNLTTVIKLTCIDIITFLKNKIDNYKLIAKKEISIFFNMFDERHSENTLFINIEHLERVLDNIMSNSFQYTPKGGSICIDVKISNEKIYFTIINSGVPFNDISNIFNKHYKEHESKMKNDGHAGLGLYIAKQLVEKSGGTINAYNPQQGGACIEFNICCNQS